jgi:hypothetical protein
MTINGRDEWQRDEDRKRAEKLAHQSADMQLDAQQWLREGRGTTTVLLGAGASVGAGVPASEAMTRELSRIYNDHQTVGRRITYLFNFIVGSKVAFDSARGASAELLPGIEWVFSAIEMMQDAEGTTFAPLVGEWRTPVPAKNRSMSGMLKHNMDRWGTKTSSPNSLYDMVTEVVKANANVEDNTTTYKMLRSSVLDELKKMTNRADAYTASYLLPLLKAKVEGQPFNIATLNYDLAIERVAETAEIPVDVGIEAWNSGTAWNWDEDEDQVRLLKLHGSIDWAWKERSYGDEPSDDDDTFGFGVDRIVRSEAFVTERYKEPALIFGEVGKLRAEGAFLPMLGEFSEMLNQGTVLLVIGYSFRDSHINVAIRRWLSSNKESTVIVVDPSLSDNLIGENPYGKKDFFKSMTDHLSADDAYCRIAFIPMRAKEAFATLFPVSIQP